MFPVMRRSRSRKGAQEDARRILVLKSGVDPLDYFKKVCQRQGAVLVSELPLINGIVCRMPNRIAVTSLETHPDIERIDLDIYLTVATPLFRAPQRRTEQQVPWGITRIAAPELWPRATGEGVRVGIIDTGVDLDHPDLAGNIAGAVNVARRDGSADDDNGHGTHVAGTIAALDNDFGVVGGAQKAKLFVAKAFDGDGSGRLSDVITGLHWCIQNRCQVVNFSFGSAEGNDSLREAIRQAGRSIVMVAAAGNNGRPDSVDFPGRYPEVIAVAASDRSDRVADFSSRGQQVVISAPGVDILSTLPGGRYGTLSGTSMASPHVAAAIAQLLQLRPGLGRSEIITALQGGATPLAGDATGCGAGVLNVAKAARLLGR